MSEISAGTSDEGESANPNLKLFLPFLFLFILVSCNDATHPVVKTNFPVLIDTTKIALKKPAKAVKQVAKKSTRQKKKIYLTFDDGPNKGTRNVLDIVQQENIPVTFFIVGEHVFASPGQNKVWDSLKTAANIELCNHSYTHAHNRYDKFYTEPGTVVKDMEKTKEKLLPGNIIVRAPGRNSWRMDSIHVTDIKKSKAAIDSLQKAGFIVMGWDLEWRYDPKTFQVKNSADELMNQIDSLFKKNKTKIADNLVILAHDQVYHSQADSLELRSFIQKLKLRDEYELALVSTYPGVVKPLTSHPE